MGRGRSRAVAVIVAGLIAAGAAAAANEADLLPGVEQTSIAQRFERRGDRPAPDVLVVAIDDKTFSDLDTQWPFPRSRHGQAIDILSRDGAKAIVYDVQFTERTTDREDNALIEAIDRAPKNIVLATAETDEHGRTNVLDGHRVANEPVPRPATRRSLQLGHHRRGRPSPRPRRHGRAR